MAFDDTPTTHISGYLLIASTAAQADALSAHGLDTTWLSANNASGAIVIPVATTSGLTEGEANGATGDWRKIAFELCKVLFDAYDAMATADKPGKATLSRSGLIAGTGDEVSRTFTNTFVLDGSGLDVIAE